MSTESGKSGLNERLVENWLTRAAEREFQIPFCQVLNSEGHEILYISPHSQFEKGKDIITRKAGKFHAFQLKKGNISVAEWDRYYGEIVRLVELPVILPGVSASNKIEPALVTTGTVSDPVFDAANTANAGWVGRGFRPLTIVAGPELVRRFLNAHGTYLPSEPRDFNLLLHLVLRPGDSGCDKKSFSKLLEGLLPFANPSTKPKDAERAIASAVLTASYVAGRPQESRNHWAVFECWVVAGAYVLAAATKFDLEDKHWLQSFNLCVLAAEEALHLLVDECLSRKHFVEGDALTDAFFYHERLTILIAAVCSYSLFHWWNDGKQPSNADIRRLVRELSSKARIWGESAVPHIAAIVWWLEINGDRKSGEYLIGRVLDAVASAARLLVRGIPNPYYSAEEAIRFNQGLDPLNLEDFVGHSYTAEPLVEMLARRWCRQAISMRWSNVSQISFAAIEIAGEWEFLRWRSDAGYMNSKLPKRPQSYAELVTQAENVDLTSLPTRLRRFPAFMLWFVQVFPQRFTRQTAAFLDQKH